VTQETPVLQIPELSHALTQVWHLLFDLALAQPDSWCLVGGLMVMLHGLEHGRSDVRPTADGDVLVDIRVRPAALREVIRFLFENGLEPELAPDGIQHRFKRATNDGELKVDVLAPDHVGARADLTTTPPGRTIEVPGGTRALQRSERVSVQAGGRTGLIRRPDVVGAILVKLAATGLPGDPARHYQDLALLLAILPNPRRARFELTSKERAKLRACQLQDRDHRAWRFLSQNDVNQGHAALQLLSTS
jgi:hypothetical protein